MTGVQTCALPISKLTFRILCYLFFSAILELVIIFSDRFMMHLLNFLHFFSSELVIFFWANLLRICGHDGVAGGEYC